MMVTQANGNVQAYWKAMKLNVRAWRTRVQVLCLLAVVEIKRFGYGKVCVHNTNIEYQLYLHRHSKYNRIRILNVWECSWSTLKTSNA